MIRNTKPLLLAMFLIVATTMHSEAKAGVEAPWPEAAPVADSAANVYQKALASTVLIATDKGRGSGALVDVEKRLVVTNYHVIRSGAPVRVWFPEFRDDVLLTEPSHYLGAEPSAAIAANIYMSDPKRDLALLQLESLPEGAAAIPFAAGSAMPGDAVHSIGNSGSSGALWVYTSGTVRQVYSKKFRVKSGFLVNAWVLETQAPINPGDSGGPVLNDEGELVGISQAFLNGANLVSLAIDIREVADLLAGNNSTIDAELKAQLDKLELKYRTTEQGEFHLQFKISEDESQLIEIPSATESYAGVSFRTIRGLALTLPERPSPAVMEWMLKSSRGLKMGAWELVQFGDKYALLLSIKVHHEISPESLRQFVHAAVNIVSQGRKEIQQLQAEAQAAQIADKSLVGNWIFKPANADAEADTERLAIAKDGTFRLLIGEFMTVTGEYQYDGKSLLLRAGSRTYRSGTVTMTSTDAFSLIVGQKTQSYERVPESSGESQGAATATLDNDNS